MAGKLSVVDKVPREFPKTATFPPPKRFLVQDSPTNPRGGLPFFEYWKEIAGTRENPKDRADLIKVKFYLHIPVVTYKAVDPTRKNSIFRTIEGPLWFEDPEDYETEVPKLLGAARWHVLLNEDGVHGHLMHAYFAAGSWDDYPLVIDLNTLVRTEPKNADYLQWLKKNKVRTPWDNPEDEENEMASDTLNVVANVLERQADAVISATKEVAEVRVQAAQDEVERIREETLDRGDKRASAETEGIKLVTEVARESNNATLAMARDMVSMSREDRRMDVNPLEVLKTAAELFRPQTDSGLGIFIEAMKDQNTKMLAMQESNQEFMRSVIGMRKSADGTWVSTQTPEAPKNDLETELTRFQRLADLFGYQKPGAVQSNPVQQIQERPPEKSLWSAIAENPVPVLTMVSTAIALIANIVYNFRSEPAKAMTPQEALVKAQQQQQQPATVAAQPQQQQTQADPRDPRNWMTFAQQIAATFKTHYHGKDNGLNGFTFAEFILSNGTGGPPNADGRRNYSAIQANLGLTGFDQVVRMFPPLWNEVKDTQEQYQQFLREFFAYDDFIKAQQEAEGAVKV